MLGTDDPKNDTSAQLGDILGFHDDFQLTQTVTSASLETLLHLAILSQSLALSEIPVS